MKLITIFLIACLCLVEITCAQDVETVISNLQQKFEQVKEYSCMQETYEKSGEKTDSRIVKIFFRKPNLIRIEVLKGRDAGGIAIYKDNFVWGRQSGWLKGIRLKFKPADKTVLSLRGSKIYETGWYYLLNEILDQKNQGYLFGAAEAIFEKTPCLILTSIYTKGEASIRHKFFIDSQSYIITGHEYYEDDVLVSSGIYKDFIINSGLSDFLFDEKNF